MIRIFRSIINNFYSSDDESSGQLKKKKKAKRVTLKDMDRKVITEREGLVI